MFYNYSIDYKTSYISVSDFFYRSYLDDFFINNFYYLWTSFLYLPILFFILYALNILSLFIAKFRLMPTVVFVTLLAFLNTFDFWGFNIVHYSDIINSEEINTLLFNTINKYHPFLFYLSSSILYSIFTATITIYSRVTSARFLTGCYLLRVTRLVITQVFIIHITLYLGSWWAVQEGSWGGWWNWDPSEVFGLTFTLPTTLYLHLRTRPSDTQYVNLLFRYYLIVISILYFLTQLNFNLVSHNFNMNSTSNMHLFILFMFLLGYLVFRFIRLFYYHSKVSTSDGLYLPITYKLAAGVTYYLLLTASITLIVLFILVTSFSTLLNELVFVVLGLDISITAGSILCFELTLFTLLLSHTWYLTYTHLLLTVIVILLNLPYYFILVALSIYYKSVTLLLHYYINLFLLISLLAVGLSITVWGSVTYNFQVDLWYNAQTYLFDILSLAPSGVDKLSICNQNLIIDQRSDALYVVSSTPESNTFHLVTMDNLSNQLLINGNYFFKTIIKVSDLTLMPLLSVFYTLLTLSYLIFSGSKLIIF